VVDSETGFDALREEWNGLVARLELPSPFQSWEWQRAWWRHLANRHLDRLRIVLFRHRGELVGIAPLKKRTVFGLTELSPLGWRDRITEHEVLLFPAAYRASLLEELWSWLSAQCWTSFGVSQLSGSDRLPRSAIASVVNSKTIVFEYLALPRSWEALYRSLTRSMRSNIRYYPKLMEREGHPYSFEIARSPGEVAAALPTLWALHTARASALTRNRHDDYLKQPSRRAFMLDAIPRLAARGEAAIGLLRVHGDIVAAQLWLEQDRAIFVYYSGYQPRWARYSVAMITTLEILKDAISRGGERVEFLRGANDFKSRWGTETRIETEFVLARRRRLVRARERYLRTSKSFRRKIDRWRTKMEGSVLWGR
jgi:CelD/BcsL family acetyltransferase involved in cellulose biosynthesis